MELTLSIIIPTHNRSQTLRQALSLLIPQAAELGSAAEIIVVDDGSKDDTESVVRALAARCPVPLHHEYQSNRGPAAARNKGMQVARSEWILFLGDDIYAQPGLLEWHLHAHQQHPRPNVAVLGRVTWDPALKPSPFMRWWENQRFRYPTPSKPRFVETWRFYTSNVSAQRTFMLSCGGFDEAFADAAFEDTEFSCRMSKRGLEVYFFPKALAYHHHPTDLAGARRQMVIAGRSFQLFHEKTGYPGLPRTWRWISLGPWMTPTVVRFLAEWTVRWRHRLGWPLLWIVILSYSFLEGRGLKPKINDW